MSATFATPNTEASILSRLLELTATGLTPAAAEFMLKIAFPDEDIARMNALTESAREGPLRSISRQSWIHTST